MDQPAALKLSSVEGVVVPNPDDWLACPLFEGPALEAATELVAGIYACQLCKQMCPDDKQTDDTVGVAGYLVIGESEDVVTVVVFGGDPAESWIQSS